MGTYRCSLHLARLKGCYRGNSEVHRVSWTLSKPTLSVPVLHSGRCSRLRTSILRDLSGLPKSKIPYGDPAESRRSLPEPTLVSVHPVVCTVVSWERIDAHSILLGLNGAIEETLRCTASVGPCKADTVCLHNCPKSSDSNWRP